MESIINLKELYKNNEDFLKGLNSINTKIKQYKKYENHLFDSPEVLYDFLTFDTKINIELERLYLYAHINSDLDLSNDLYQEYTGKVLNLFNIISEYTSYVIPEILSHDYKEFLNFCKKNKKLNEYKLNIKSIFRNKKLTLSKEEEKLVTILTSNFNKPEEISELLINTDLYYGNIKDENNKEVLLTNSNYSTYLESKDRRVRKETFETLYKEFKMHENTFSSVLALEVANNNRIAKIRKFSSSRKLSLYHNEIDNNIYDKLIDGVSKNLNVFYKYYELKQKILNIKDFHLYDTFANITNNYDKTYSYEEAKDIILKSLSVLGKDYIKDLTKAFDNNWIDSRIIKTKRSGAYCTCAYCTHPYVVCSFEGKLNDISTIAHELGHAMHYYYAMNNNEYQNYNYSIFVAEVASQVNEIILTDYMLKNSTDKEEKKYLLDLILQRFKSTIVRQTMFAEYEDKIHNLENNGNILTKDLLESTYYELNKKYFGKNVIVDDEIKYECFRIPHFYYNFYVYQYATGYAAALKIADKLINKEPGALEGYLKFLKLGSTKDPVSSLKVAGVDIKDEKIYDDVFEIFNKKTEELRSLYE